MDLSRRCRRCRSSHLWGPTIHSKTIDCGVAHEVGAHFEVVLADYPGERVSKSGKILIQRSVGVTASILESCKGAIEVDCGMTECLELIGSYYRSISIDIRL